MDSLVVARQFGFTGTGLALPERYVVICPQGLGDSLQATPLVEAIRLAKPKAEIEVVVMRKASQALFAGLPQLVDTVRYLPYWESGSVAFATSAVKMLGARTAEASFMSFPSARRQYAMLHALVRAKRRYTHDYPEARGVYKMLPSTVIVPVRDRANTLRNMDLLDAAGFAADTPAGYSVPETWKSGRPRDPRRIIMHAGSIAHDGFDYKRWPEASFAELARRLVAAELDVALLSGPEERALTGRISDAAPGTRLVSGNLEEAARIVSEAGLVIANDNGIAHLAAGVGTPVIALFGPTPLYHAPFGPKVRALRPSECPPCFSPMRIGMNCIRNIDYRCLKVDLSVDYAEKIVLETISGIGKENVSSTP